MADRDGETALITGASSGIGMATALYMAERGFSVIGTGRSDERLAPLREEAARRGLALRALEMDINSEEAVGEAMTRLLAEGSGIDVLVNNAGYGLWGPVGTLSLDQVRDQMETNYFAAVRLILAVLPAMTARRRGTIINISSVEGRLATPFSGAYAASKFALEGLSEALRLEVWGLGVRVALVEPGLIRTRFQENQVIGEHADLKDSPYDPYVQRYRERRGRYDRFGTDPVKVAKVVHKIARARRPRFRYPVNIEARVGAMAARLLPERVFLALMGRATMG